MMIERTIEPIFRTVCIFYNLKGTDTIYLLRVREKNGLFPLYNVIEYFEGRFSNLYSGNNESEVKEILSKSLGMEPF